MSKLIALFGAGLLIFQTACSTSSSLKSVSSGSDILEPIDERPTPETTSLPSPQLERVTQLLAGLGYQGIGLDHEDEGTLSFVEAVFSSPKTRNRKIRLIYTGLQLSYDKEQESLTLGEEVPLEKTIRFIEKNVPRR